MYTVHASPNTILCCLFPQNLNFGLSGLDTPINITYVHPEAELFNKSSCKGLEQLANQAACKSQINSSESTETYVTFSARTGVTIPHIL